MSCSAKLPIYGMFSAAFFPQHAAYVMIGLYLFGIFCGILAALVLKMCIRDSFFTESCPHQKPALPRAKKSGKPKALRPFFASFHPARYAFL